MGSLEVAIMRSQQTIGVWSSRGNQGNTWREATARLPSVLPSDQVHNLNIANVHQLI